MAEAHTQLSQLNGQLHHADLHDRFLTWARARGPAAQVHGPAAQVRGPAARVHGPAAQVHGPAGSARGPAARATMFHVNPDPGAQIHHTDPFAVPAGQRSPVRRFRGRFAAPVTLWTAPGPAGLTVSSTLVADGTPGRLLGLIDAESDLWAAIEEAGRFAVVPLGPGHRQLADRFAGLFPSPGGLFAIDAWTETPYGPVPADAGGWAGCRLDAAREYGWSLLVEATIEQVELVDGTEPLLHHRGRYHELR
nr:flavin reductase family protein [Micromonospora radicis]